MRKQAGAWLGLGVACVVLPVYLATLAPGLTWANQGQDGGDLITAAATFGVAHPSGYPTYLLLARLWQAIPMGTLASRTNLFSAVAAAGAAGLMVSLTSRAYGGAQRWGLVGGVAAGLGFGLAPLVWSQAVITEVHALHTLFTGWLLWSLPHQGGMALGRWTHGAAGLIAGLALGNHLTTALLLPAWLGITAWHTRMDKRAWGWRLAGLGLGLIVYAYLPVAASTRPPVSWGDARTLEGFWWVVSGAPYRDLAFALGPEFIVGRVQGWARLFQDQFGWVGMALALAGLFMGRARGAVPRAWTAWIVAVGSVFAIGYNTPDSQAYLLPVFQVMALWLGVGVATGMEAASRWRPKGLLRAALLGGVGLALAVNAARTWPIMDASRDDRAETFGRSVMAAAPTDAVVVTQGDADTFALWYFHFALGQRPDLTVVVEPLLAFEWYRETLDTIYPDLAESLGQGSWRAALMAHGRTVCEAQVGEAEGVVCSQP